MTDEAFVDPQVLDAIEKVPFGQFNGDKTRPLIWEEYIGQEEMKERLKVHSAAAKRRGERMEHVLLMGPPGCGKTSLASLIAKEAGVPFLSFISPLNGEAMKRLIGFEGVALIDEVHKMKADQEKLLTVVEDGYYQHENGIRRATPNLTIVAATTEYGMVYDSLKDRFHVKPSFKDYTQSELAQIAIIMGAKLKVDVDKETAFAYAAAANKKPRRIREFVVMARDYDNTDPATLFAIMGITNTGLEEEHIRYMQALSKMNYVAGVARIAAHLRMKQPEIIDLEQILVDQGLVEYHPKGRMLTTAGVQELGEEV